MLLAFYSNFDSDSDSKSDSNFELEVDDGASAHTACNVNNEEDDCTEHMLIVTSKSCRKALLDKYDKCSYKQSCYFYFYFTCTY